MKDKILSLLAIFSLLGAFFGGYAYFEGRYAHCTDVAQMKQTYDYKFKTIEIKSINERIWQLEDRLKKNPNDKSAQEELRKLKEEKAVATDELKKIGERR